MGSDRLSTGSGQGKIPLGSIWVWTSWDVFCKWRPTQEHHIVHGGWIPIGSGTGPTICVHPFLLDPAFCGKQKKGVAMLSATPSRD